MILLLPPEWITKDRVMSDDVGAALHAILTVVYDESLSESNKWWPCIKPEGFPWEGEIVDLRTENDKHNNLFAVFHKADNDGVITNALHALEVAGARIAKLSIIPVGADQSTATPEVWYAGVKLNGAGAAISSLAELIGVKPIDKPIH